MRKSSIFVVSLALALGVMLGWVLFGSHGSIPTQAQARAPEASKSEAEAKTAAVPPRVDHILLEVTNMEASLRFYRDLMGLQPKSLSGHFSTLKGANVDIYLSTYPWEWKAPRGKDERLGLGMYPHFEVPDVEAVVARARSAGYAVVQEPHRYDWGTEAFVADPDGYNWALVSLPKQP
jgi:catechol 2,3-dioxygenase-like lactoylglutathione lyase family enzyme